MKPPQEQLQIIKRGVSELISEQELLDKLDNAYRKKIPLKVKAGFDPSAPDIHLGHTVLLRKLKHFQQLGHEIYFLIGDFTARIGDPSGQNRTRPALSKDQIKKNAITYKRQIFKILDPKKTKIVFNSKWCEKMSIDDFLKLTSHYTIARLLERDDFSKRYQQKDPITILEFIYPLIQGYDSVVLKADVEIGGTDQKFNLLVGRELQRDYNQAPQVIITMPILEGTDGKQKMSKSLNNYIAIEDSADDMYGKIMSIPDSIMERYFLLLTDIPFERVKDLHPKQAKASLAKEVVTDYYGEDAALKAEERFEKLFSRRETPTTVDSFYLIPGLLSADGKIWIVKLLTEINAVESNSQARRLIGQGAVSLDGVRITDSNSSVEVKDGMLVKVGKFFYKKIYLKAS
jgi:tyrosyl-tRNA synthetase